MLYGINEVARKRNLLFQDTNICKTQVETAGVFCGNN
jgi:hypothetical protein